jgi:hypothetical protein
MTVTRTEPVSLNEVVSAAGSTEPPDSLGDGLRARLLSLLDVVNTAPPQGQLRSDAIADISGVLRRRLQLEADRSVHPEIADERIVRPVFIVGLPRTGTTLLHSLLSSEPGARAPRLWEVRNPSPPPGASGIDQERMALGDADARAWCELVPGMLTAHPYFDLGGWTPVEDEELLTLDFQNAYPTWYPRLPVLLQGVSSGDPAVAYAFHHRFLQHLQWRRPTSRWVLKGTTHQFTLDALWAEYPDALCIWPHRSPGDSLGSLLELQSMTTEAIVGPIDRPALARIVLDRLRAGFDAVLSSPVMADDRLVHVRYPDLVADPVATIQQVYHRWDVEISGAFEESMRSWLADPAHRSDRHGRFTFSLDSFGVSRDDINALFVDYRERFAL